MKTNPNDPNVYMVGQFKLKLQDTFIQQSENIQKVGDTKIYRTAAVDYLREINKYTCDQLIQTVNPASSSDCIKKCRYVLTVPATWVNKDFSAMRDIAIEAGLINDICDPKERLVIINEAHAASLFCEREYCMMDDGISSKLTKGQRYLVCDAGGGTIDLATYECTGSDDNSIKNGHCQLALESGGSCGSTILDRNMETYLRDHVFIGCIEEHVLQLLIDQFVKEIKHYFGGDSGKNNFKHTEIVSPATTSKVDVPSATVLTTENLKMMDIRENDYNYDEDYQDYDSDVYMDDEYMDTDEISISEEEMKYIEDNGNSFEFNIVNHSKTLSPRDYIYFTLPESDTGIDQSILENLSLKGDIITNNKSKQLRVSNQDISKYVFDPVVSEVIALIQKQIKKSYTTIDTLFLLGGFGQSPYLYKKLHEEFLTSINAVNRLIVPEDGYRASMRGGIYFGIDCVEMIPKCYVKDKEGHYKLNTNLFKMLVAIDINMSDLTASYSFIELENLNSTTEKYNLAEKIVEADLESTHGVYRSFSFNSERFMIDYFTSIVETLTFYAEALIAFSEFPRTGNLPLWLELANEKLYYSYLVDGFIRQLFGYIEQDFITNKFHPKIDWNPRNVRYTVSVTQSSPKKNLTQTRNSNFRNIPGNNMDELKKYFLLLLGQESSKFPPESVTTLYNYVIKIWDDDDSIIIEKKTLASSVLSKYVYDAAADIGVVERGDSRLEIYWCQQNLTSVLAYRYFFSAVSTLMQTDTLSSGDGPNFISNSKNTNVAIENSLRAVTRMKSRPSYDIYTFNLHSIEKTGQVLSFSHISRRPEYFKFNTYTLLFEQNQVFFDWISQHKNPQLLAEELENGIYFEAVIYNLANKINFMKTEVCAYIKNNIDLSNPNETHTLEDFFAIPEDSDQKNLILWYQRLSTSGTYNSVFDCIRHLRHTTMTTEFIQNSLIIPWMQYQLTPAIMDVCIRHRNLKNSPNSEECCLLFTGEIVETKYNGLMPKESGSSITCEAFIFGVLKENLEAYFEQELGNSISHRILYDDNSKYSRHIDGVVNGIFLENKSSVLKRIARRRYAVHFLNYNVKKSTTQQKEWTVVSDKEAVGAEDKKKGRVLIDLQEDSLTLHPLIKKDQELYDHLNKCFRNYDNNFYVKNECSVAAVLYASEDDDHQEHYISNNSFKKLHRFIIPIKDVNRPIVFTHIVENHSILFTVKQDSYEADFRCSDLLYRSL